MTISFARHQFPPAIIRHAVWLYVHFTLSYRDVEDLLAERGLDVSYESVRRWVLKFGPLFARELRRRRARPTSCWHLDEMAVRRCQSNGGSSTFSATTISRTAIYAARARHSAKAAERLCL
jgi:transposase-like protein